MPDFNSDNLYRMVDNWIFSCFWTNLGWIGVYRRSRIVSFACWSEHVSALARFGVSLEIVFQDS